MNKLCKTKLTKPVLTAMIWTEMLYQVWLHENSQVFEDRQMSPGQVAHTVIFCVAARLKDDRRYSLIV